MICKSCGTQNDDSSKFCKSCGARLIKVSAPAAEDGQTAELNNMPFPVNPGQVNPQKQEKKKGNLKVIIPAVLAIILCIAIIAVAIVLLNGRRTAVNMDEYVIVSVTGFDGYGTATADIDWDQFNEDYDSKLSYTSSMKKLYSSDELNAYPKSDFISEYTSVYCDNTSDLSNGDTVSWHLTIDTDSIEKMLKCKIKYSASKTITITELEAVKTVDPFDGLTVTYKGENGSSYVSWSYSGEYFTANDFWCDNTNFSNGDTIEMYLNNYDEEYFSQTYGVKASKTKKSYTVSGLTGKSSSEASSEEHEDEENEVHETSGDYLCSYSSDRPLTDADVSGLISRYSSTSFPGDRTVIQMLINEIYAKNGYEFQDKQLTQYFEQYEWYRNITNRTSDQAQVAKRMSSIEYDNVNFLKNYK